MGTMKDEEIINIFSDIVIFAKMGAGRDLKKEKAADAQKIMAEFLKLCRHFDTVDVYTAFEAMKQGNPFDLFNFQMWANSIRFARDERTKIEPAEKHEYASRDEAVNLVNKFVSAFFSEKTTRQEMIDAGIVDAKTILFWSERPWLRLDQVPGQTDKKIYRKIIGKKYPWVFMQGVLNG